MNKRIKFITTIAGLIVTIVFIYFFFSLYSQRSKAAIEKVSVNFAPTEVTVSQNEAFNLGLTLSAENNKLISGVDLTIRFDTIDEDILDFISFLQIPNNYFDQKVLESVTTDTTNRKVLRLVLIAKKNDTQLANTVTMNLTFKSKKAGLATISLVKNQSKIVGATNGQYFDIKENSVTAQVTVTDQSYCEADEACGTAATCNSNTCVCNEGKFNCDNQWGNGCELDYPCGTTPPVDVTGTETVDLDFKIKLQGITRQPALTTVSTVRLTIDGGGLSEKKIFNNVTVTADENGIWSGTVNLTNVPPGSGYSIFVKGPKHLQKELCELSPTPEGDGSAYKCASKAITLTAGINSADFSKVPLLVGDLPPQDGLLNALDIALISEKLLQSTSEALEAADLNFDGIVNSADYSLMIESMRIKFEED